MSLTATTELEAVNVLLASIGEAPVSQLGSGLDEEAIAASTLTEVSRAVQLKGWSWNTEENYPLTKNLIGEIYLPTNALKIDYQSTRYVTRGQRAYDKTAHTYTLDTNLKATIIFGLSWEELPEAMRSYVMYRAGRVFQGRQVGSQVLYEFTKQDEQDAWLILSSAEHENANLSLFDNAEIQHMLDRSSSTPVRDYPAGSFGGLLYE